MPYFSASLDPTQYHTTFVEDTGCLPCHLLDNFSNAVVQSIQVPHIVVDITHKTKVVIFENDSNFQIQKFKCSCPLHCPLVFVLFGLPVTSLTEAGSSSTVLGN